jgi:hypothetical protein
MNKTPALTKKCKAESLELYYIRDVFEIIDPGKEFEENIRRIKTEIYSFGPVVTGIIVYDDLFHYRSGVYKASKMANLIGGHAVEIVGWGEEPGSGDLTGKPVRYWVIKNSWSTSWGNNGYWKQDMDDPMTFPKSKLSFVSGFLQLENPFNTKRMCK